MPNYGKNILFLSKRLYLILTAFLIIFSENGNALEPPMWWREIHGYDPQAGWYSSLTYTAAKFGPNAMPVPEVRDGRVPEKNELELSSDVFWGFGDQTQSLSARFSYVPVPGKLSLNAWGVLTEHYQTTIAVRDERASLNESGRGFSLLGDWCLSVQMRILKEKKYLPEFILESVLKTSSSSSPQDVRYFDTPGYWFMASVSKSFRPDMKGLQEIRLVGNYGFLCYQMNQVHQNDAPLFGGKALFYSGDFTLETGLHGYSGWTNNGDHPLVLRGKLSYQTGRANYFVQYQHAFRDYPFRRLQTGVCLSF